MQRAVVVFVAAIAATVSCDDSALGPVHRHLNRAPETVLSGGPPAFTHGTDYRVQLFWAGYDADGRIDHYDFILVDHSAIGDSLHAVDSLVAGHSYGRLPEPDDPRWTSTTAHDSLFLTRADSLPRPPRPAPGEDEDFVRRQSFERWHTFFVRAVDNEGAVDPTPDYRSFNSTTLAPDVHLTSPVAAGHEFQAPPTSIFRWDGSDPDGSTNTRQPIAARWVLLPSRRNAQSEYVGYPDALYELAPSTWSPWHAWGATDESGRRAILRNLDPLDPARPGTGFYLFAVQTMDEAGAVSPVFDHYSPGHNNVARVFVSGLVGPTLVVDERYLGTYTFVGESRPVPLDVATEQPIHFRWRADGAAYGGRVVGYRWAWDLRDPTDDSAWESWSETSVASEPRVFASGVHRFYLQVRDDAGTIVGAQFEITVHTFTQRRRLLWVDDSVQQQAGDEAREDQRWLAVLDTVAVRGGFAFDHDRDVYDTSAADTRSIPPPLSKVFDYEAVVWSVVAPARGTALRDVAMWIDPFVERNRNRTSRFNYLNVFIENGGKLWLNGTQLSYQLWPVSDGLYRPPDHTQLPVNLVRWDDRQTPHPQIDSVGVTSLLYKMGIEAFDLGGGSGAPYHRSDGIDHGCTGFQRAALDLPGPAVLFTDAGWPQPGDPLLNPLHCRQNVEIYNMPYELAAPPPLRPPAELVRTLYKYSSGVRRDPDSGRLYPLTADGEPALILRRTVANGPYTRAYCGFEPWLLRADSHLGLADAILLGIFHVGSGTHAGSGAAAPAVE